MGFQQEYDATIAASEDLDLPQYAGASSSIQHTATSTVHTLLKPSSFGTGLKKLSADCVSVSGRTCIKKLACVGMDSEKVVFSLCQRRRRDKILERKAELAVRREKMAQQRLYEAEADVEVKNIGKRETLTLLFMRSIKSLNPNGYSNNNKRISGLIKLKDKKKACVENWK